jgi:predicted 3-demethylubiquinone-9 3-methyltransferase (glyoxalase superfamily)
MPEITQKIFPCLWFDDKAEEAANFYIETFGNGRIVNVRRAPADYPSGQAGDVLVVIFELFGQRYTGLNGGPTFKFNEAFSLEVRCEDQAEVDKYWEALTAGGGEESVCGWLKDKYGLSWQITPQRLVDLMADPDPDRAKRAMECMMKQKKIIISEIEAAADGK